MRPQEGRLTVNIVVCGRAGECGLFTSRLADFPLLAVVFRVDVDHPLVCRQDQDADLAFFI